MHMHCNAKNCMFIAAILSELQGYVIGLTTLKVLQSRSNRQRLDRVKHAPPNYGTLDLQLTIKLASFKHKIILSLVVVSSWEVV